MLHLGLSVSVGNILLWIFTEIFVVLMTFQATRLLARYSLNRTLTRGKKIRLNPTMTLIDTLPYNSDLHPLPSRTKLPLTFARLVAIALSVYLGYTLDGAVRTARGHFPVSAATEIAPVPGTTLTPNNGSSIAAMAKVSCLHIHDASHLVLFKAFVNKNHILCEDGRATFSKRVLLEAELRSGKQAAREGLSLAGMNLGKWPSGPRVPGLVITDRYVSYAPPDRPTRDSCRIVLQARLEDRKCQFGVWRSTGSGFVSPINILVTTKCSLQILEFPRLLRAKPEHMPPRMSFLHQIIDAVVVSVPEDAAPERKGSDVIATMSTAGMVVLVSVAIFTTGVSMVVWLLLKRATVQEDVMSPKGVASLWGCEKYGSEKARSSSGELFIALDRNGKVPYLGSEDKGSMDDDLPLDKRKGVSGLEVCGDLGSCPSESSEPSTEGDV